MMLTCMGNESSSDKFANKYSQVGSNGCHTILEVIIELSTVISDFNHLK